jgi:hypothetical protein
MGVLAAVLWVELPVAATDAPPELGGVLENLMSWLPGEYDNAAQVAVERAQGVAEKNIHQRIYRAYHPIDAPAVGEHVLLFEVRNGGKLEPLDMAEFQVWILSVDAQRNAVRMSPRRFVDDKKYVNALRDPAILNDLRPAELKPGVGAAGCDIFWRPRRQKIVGRTEAGACKYVSRSTSEQMDFSWEFTQSDTDQWISFAGRDATGKIVFGREDQIAWRLDKMVDLD